MKTHAKIRLLILFLLIVTINATQVKAQTIALWLFDEPQGLYPSHVIDDASENDYPLVIGRCGKIVKGKYGNALDATAYMKLEIPDLNEPLFGLGKPLPVPQGRTTEPMNWKNALFTAIMTAGEKHLRKEIEMANASKTKLNLGNFDWTVEFWYKPIVKRSSEGVIFEIGEGPLREKNSITNLRVSKDGKGFIFENTPSKTEAFIKSDQGILNDLGKWHHYTFIYDSGKNELTHYLDGKKKSTIPIQMKALSETGESYFSLGKNGFWKNTLNGALDEVEFFQGIKDRNSIKDIGTRSPQVNSEKLTLKKGLPLLFKSGSSAPLHLGDRKLVFIDDAFVEKMDDDLKFVVNPPKKMERVIGNIKGPFRKHLTVVEDEKGVIRIYNSVDDDYLAVRTSTDGIHFTEPDFGDPYKGKTNIVIKENVGGLGNPFIDPNGPDSERWKYFSDYARRGIYLYTSPDGYHWKRKKTATIPFRSGTQSCSFYDEQQQEYITYHRSGIFLTPANDTQRSSVVVALKDLAVPDQFTPLTQQDYVNYKGKFRIRDPKPWFLDNGPLTPGGFGIEYEHKFDPVPQDPPGTDIYVTKAIKYQWAPDTYVAFPIVYFHYENDGPETRRVLGDKARGLGSGPIETQLAVSRDGFHWKRYSRPTYLGPGEHNGRNVITAYIADGMVKRGNEIWQYYFGETQYHSAFKKDLDGRGVYRLVQRLDGFVSLDSPYDREVEMTTKPFTFDGDFLSLNIDTDAAGYTQIGILDENGTPIEGFSLDECIYINGE
ncbi:MAG: LamG domain-containing protein [Flavobacteriaceae bacterium]|nr:LamG domain-containing protein [Flavobacteriaceae bacterium]